MPSRIGRLTRFVLFLPPSRTPQAATHARHSTACRSSSITSLEKSTPAPANPSLLSLPTPATARSPPRLVDLQQRSSNRTGTTTMEILRAGRKRRRRKRLRLERGLGVWTFEGVMRAQRTERDGEGCRGCRNRSFCCDFFISSPSFPSLPLPSLRRFVHLPRVFAQAALHLAVVLCTSESSPNLLAPAMTPSSAPSKGRPILGGKTS
jgi:hypothetical protein